MSGSRNAARAGAAAVACAAVMAIGCASGVGPPPQEVTAFTAGGVQRVRVEAHSYYFQPNRVVLKQGVPTELTLVNRAFFVPHDLSCAADEAGLGLDVELGVFGTSKRVTFTPTKAGEYVFFCAIEGHWDKGMMGLFVVVP